MFSEQMFWQERTKLLLGEKHEKLVNAAVFIAGLGGVGGYAAEHLCRAGIGNITVVDADTVHPSNINRQIFALHSTVGKAKTALALQRLKDINPSANILAKQVFIDEQNIADLLPAAKYDYVVDAIDTIKPKIALLKHCVNNNIPVISSMGAGGRTDISKVQIADISKSYNCPLARTLRKRLHKAGIRKGIKVVFSSELPDKQSVIEVQEQNKKSTLGTISYLPAVFGLYLAWAVINDLTK